MGDYLSGSDLFQTVKMVLILLELAIVLQLSEKRQSKKVNTKHDIK